MPIYRCKRCGFLAGDLLPRRCPVCRGKRFDDFRALNRAGRLAWPPTKPRLRAAIMVTAIIALLIAVINLLT
ncbi:MAG TPA: hypothetical protein VND64_17645 [Pirellulales bacterium]|nr:hypothetical protein [Pirellulales bacterium]